MSRFGANFDRAQAAWDNQLPPGYDDPEYAEDCEDGECGECEPCCIKAAEAYEEDQAEALYEARKERGYRYGFYN